MDDESPVEDKKDEQPIKLWFKELELSKKRDKDWILEGKKIHARHRNETNSGVKKQHFNILWSNTETLRPAIYSRPPRPDIRRRFKDADPMALHIVELLERSATFTFENADLHSSMIFAVNDMLLPGRAATRIRYVPEFDENDEVSSEEIQYEDVDWDKLLLGPGEKWDILPWIAFYHELDEEQVEKLNPDAVDKIAFDISADTEGEDTNKDRSSDAVIYKRAVFWEIWDKASRQVLWVAESYKDGFIKIEDDPLELKQFWPIPRPLYATESTTSLVPVPEFRQYEDLADNLNDVTIRMTRITKALRVRGIYDSTMSEIKKLFDADDNDMIPAEGLSRITEAGGIEKFIWMMPNDILAKTLTELFKYRQALIQQIYELTGISDILRGSSNPHETLGAQKIKANFGAQRLTNKQNEVQRYVRDLLRLTVELIAEKFSTETLSKMTGLKFPTQQEQEQAKQLMAQFQQQVQQAQAQGQQPPSPPPEQAKQVQEILSKPSWEQLQEILQSDILRAYVVDIETDSTIEADQKADQESLASLMQGISQFGHGMKPMLESGVMDAEAAKKVLVGFLRRYRLGREVEEAIMSASGKPPPDPAAEAAKQKAQGEQQKQQAEQQKQQAEMQQQQAEMKMDMERMGQEAQLAQREQQMAMKTMQMETQQAGAKHAQAMESMRLKMQQDSEKHSFEMAKIRAQKEGLNERAKASS